jgi:hypothetical protein
VFARRAKHPDSSLVVLRLHSLCLPELQVGGCCCCPSLSSSFSLLSGSGRFFFSSSSRVYVRVCVGKMALTASRSFLSWTRAERLGGAGRGGLRGGKLVWSHIERCGNFCPLAGSVSGICTGRKNISLHVQIVLSTLTLKVLFLGVASFNNYPSLIPSFCSGILNRYRLARDHVLPRRALQVC